MLERKGKVRAQTAMNTKSGTLLPLLRNNVAIGSTVYTDEYRAYDRLKKHGFKHQRVNHGINKYVVGDAHTNSIEGFWSQVKRSISGTNHAVSAKYLQSYLDQADVPSSFLPRPPKLATPNQGCFLFGIIHTMQKQTLILLGNPKSVNHTYRRSRNGGIYMVKGAVDTKGLYQISLRQQWKKPMITGGVKLNMRVYFKDMRRRDLDNTLKLILDSLSGIVYKDDHQIWKLAVERFIDQRNPRVEIDV